MMKCKECPVRGQCTDEKEYGPSCCFKTWDEECPETSTCTVKDECEAVTNAGEAVAIVEEYDPNTRLCYGSWPEKSKLRNVCKAKCNRIAMHCRDAYTSGVWKEMTRGCAIDPGVVVVLEEKS